jgi:hypothetical protein
MLTVYLIKKGRCVYKMIESASYDIFATSRDLKYAAYWSKVESFLTNPVYLVNMGELLTIASEEILIRLCASYQCFIEIEAAYTICHKIQDAVIKMTVSNVDLNDEELYKICENEAYNIITDSKCLSNGDSNNYRHLGTFLTDYLKSFIRLKKGSHIFGDFLFSNSIITNNLEENSNITELLGFISALGPNVFSGIKSDE